MADRSGGPRSRLPRTRARAGPAEVLCSSTRRHELTPRRGRWRDRGGAECPAPLSLQTALPWRTAPLFFLLEQVVVLFDEVQNDVLHPQQLFPLLAVERDREAAHPVNGQRALLAHFQRHLAARFFQ